MAGRRCITSRELPGLARAAVIQTALVARPGGMSTRTSGSGVSESAARLAMQLVANGWLWLQPNSEQQVAFSGQLPWLAATISRAVSFASMTTPLRSVTMIPKRKSSPTSPAVREVSYGGIDSRDEIGAVFEVAANGTSHLDLFRFLFRSYLGYLGAVNS